MSQFDREYLRQTFDEAAEYLDLLLAYSGHCALPTGALRSLLSCIADLSHTHHGRRIAKCHLTELRVAQRRSG